MNVQFKCFKCESIQRIEVHSYSWNKEKEPYIIPKLCKHFSNIKLKWKTKYGFFTIGWQVKIYDVSVECSKCRRTIRFQSQTFQKDNPSYEEPRDCCDNVIVYSAHEGYFSCGSEGKKLQENINRQIKEIKAAEEALKKLKEEEEKLEREERQWKRQEEEERRDKEEEEKKEKEKQKRRRNQYERENKEMLEIIKQQEEENKKLNQQINVGTSWIEEQMNQMISEANATYSNNINFSSQKTIKANYQYKMGK